MCTFASGTAYFVKKTRRAYSVFGSIGVCNYSDDR